MQRFCIPIQELFAISFKNFFQKFLQKNPRKNFAENFGGKSQEKILQKSSPKPISPKG
jgi:hypothetical protein